MLTAVLRRWSRPTICGRIIGTTRPGLDRLAVVLFHRDFDLLQQVKIDKRTFFFSERGTVVSLYLLAAADDHVIGTLVRASLLTLGLKTPRRYRMTTSRGTAFTTMRVVDRVHRHAANGRANTTPARSTGHPANAGCARVRGLRPGSHGTQPGLYAFHRSADAGLRTHLHARPAGRKRQRSERSERLCGFSSIP